VSIYTGTNLIGAGDSASNSATGKQQQGHSTSEHQAAIVN
jgi:hypothetical protein